MNGSVGLGSGSETGRGEDEDLGRQGLGATAGLGLLSVDGEVGETTDDWEREPGLGAMGGLAVTGSLGLGASGGFFTPVHKKINKNND